MNKTMAFAGVALAYIAYTAWKVKSSVQMFQYTLTGLKVGRDGLTPVITVKLNVFNPNQTSVPITGIAGTLYFKGSPVGTVNNVAPITIGAQQANTIELKARIALLMLVSAIAAPGAEKGIGFKGLLHTSLFQMPLEYNTGAIGRIRLPFRRRKPAPRPFKKGFPYQLPPLTVQHLEPAPVMDFAPPPADIPNE